MTTPERFLIVGLLIAMVLVGTCQAESLEGNVTRLAWTACPKKAATWHEIRLPERAWQDPMVRELVLVCDASQLALANLRAQAGGFALDVFLADNAVMDRPGYVRVRIGPYQYGQCQKINQAFQEAGVGTTPCTPVRL